MHKYCDKPASKLAIEYWNLEENATFLDMILYLRKDKELHRDYNNEIASDYKSYMPASDTYDERE